MRPILLSILLLPITLNGQQWNWAASAGGGGNTDFCQGIATDSQGNVYWAGSVSGTVDFGCGTLSPGSTVAGFVAKRSATGACLWVRGITVGFNQAWAYGIAIDADDRIYVTGKYNGNATFSDGVTLNSLGNDDIFLARYDTAGTCMWARRAGSSGSSDEARGVAVSADGGVFIAGYSGGNSIGFDGISIPNAGNFRQVVIARYDSTGTVQWARASTGNGQGKTCRGISVENGRLFVTGQVGFNSSSYDGLALSPSASGTWLYVLATDLDGNGLWARSYGSGDNEGMGISADTLGNVFVGARLWGNLHLPDDTLSSVSSNDDILVMKLDREGTFHWAKSTGSSQRDLAFDVEADCMGNVLVAAQFNQSIDFFGTPVAALGGEDVLIAKLDGDGDVVWTTRPSGFQRDVPLCIHRQKEAPNAIYFGGYYWGAITYGNTTVDDVLNGDAMLVAGLDTTFAISTYAHAICPGSCDGVAYAFASGQGPFTYLWNNGANTPSINGLCAGTYVVEIADGDGNSRVDTVVVQESSDPGYTVQLLGELLWTEGGMSWAWYLNATTPVSDSASVLATTGGAYHALVTDANGCVWSTDTVNVLITHVPDGITDVGLHVWPNPMVDQVTIQGLRPGTYVQLFDVMGRMVHEEQAVSSAIRLSTTALPQGGYLLRTSEGQQRVLVK